MPAAFITCVGPRPALCRRLGGEKFGLRFSTAAIAKRRAAAINSRSATATRTADRGFLALQWETLGDPILHSAVHRNGIHATGRSQDPRRKAGPSVTAGGNDINVLCRRASPSKNPARRELIKGNRARPRDVHDGKFFL